MEFVPICLECNNFGNGNKCPFFTPIPHEIKNREIKCPHFTGGAYDLLTADAYPETEENGI